MTRYRMGRRAFLALSALGAYTGGRTYAAPNRTRRISTFTCEVTPPLGTPIYSSYKPLAVVEHPLLAKGIVLEDGGRRYVICAVDYCEICNATHDLYRRLVAEAAETEPAYVAVQTVHQHTAPMADSEGVRIFAASENPSPYPAIETFEEPAARIAEAVRASLAALEPYDRVGLGQAKVERVASNRRIPIGDGKVGFRASSCTDPAMIALPEGQIDPYLKTVTFANGERPIARLHYYATHPQSFYGDPRASYDFAGMAREKIQETEGVFQVYFNGCGGDIAAGKYNDRTPEAREGLYQRLLAGMEASVAATQYKPASDITWKNVPLTLIPRDDGGFGEADARAKMNKADGIWSTRIDAAMVLSWRARADRPFDLTALHMDGLSMLHLPGEAMIDFQLYAQSLAPDKFVAVAAYGDCGPAYICLEKSFAEGGYEPSASHTTPASEGLLRTAIRELLQA